MHSDRATPPPDILDALRRMGLLASNATPLGEALTGVSSDIWRIELPKGPVCVQRALAKLRVAADLANRRALVRGDVGAKNILAGPTGPVFLDAECAWWGDPAFDLAFCLNHLLLKCLWIPSVRASFLAGFDSMANTCQAGVAWEPLNTLEVRVAHLLPGLFLARVDGKSPVEYITAEADKNRARRVARAMPLAPPTRLDAIRQAWTRELAT
jgi:hypothetical protein